MIEDGESEDDFIFPRWPFDVLKVLVFVAFVWIAYRVGRSLLARRESDPEDEFDEFRGDSGSGGPGLGGLLRGLFGRARPPDDGLAIAAADLRGVRPHRHRR